ncbi:DUF1850 domain-containing protein [Pseudomonas sp. HR96]|uniref:DUF1850 domain-containing protein n=1 Tax=Pseudomonas sp. HR96 TaxID=1027966 RepID=UPI002A761AFE|nr:DUF1850 domain-containing protein [Pseudomonas sp. HR96]WPP01591.1 DUF1850 domain-containing protein [Pseudomonas sp. HR96]
MIGVCLGLAGVIWAQLPEAEFTLGWQHSVEKLRWEEDYQVQGRQLLLARARVEGSGAGMEIPADARWSRGRWHYAPGLHLDVLRLARSPAAGDYQICQTGVCHDLAHWLGPPSEQSPALELWVCDLG